jgi:hypothetical protein
MRSHDVHRRPEDAFITLLKRNLWRSKAVFFKLRIIGTDTDTTVRRRSSP